MIYAHFKENCSCKNVILILYCTLAIMIIVEILLTFQFVFLFIHGDSDLLYLSVLAVLALSLIYECACVRWILSKVDLSEDGILVRMILSEKFHAWGDVKECGIFSLSLFTGSNITPYFFFILSSPEHVKCSCKTLSDAFFLKNSLIVVRYTPDRKKRIESFLHDTIRIYDWNDLHAVFELRENSSNKPPASPFPRWQRYEEGKKVGTETNAWLWDDR